MSEPFGVVAGAIGIAAAFTACVDCFSYIQFGRHFGRDFQTDLISLNCARLRLSRWGQAVNIYNDPKLGRPEATATEIQTAKDTLMQIPVLFDHSAKVSNKYELSARAGEDLTPFSAIDMDSDYLEVENKMKRLAIKRQKGTHLLKLTSWALYHRSNLKELIENIAALVANLETLFPAPQTRIELVREEVAEISDKRSLELVEEAAEGIHGVLKTAAREKMTSHQYLKIVIKGQGQVGDAYGIGWTGNARGASHKYDDIEVEAGGKALIGNKYGGKDFWDD